MDPREKGPKPPHATTNQEYPGMEAEMDPRPDYGERSYKGTGKLTGKAAVITGGGRGIGPAAAPALAPGGGAAPVSFPSGGGGAPGTARGGEAAGPGCVAPPGGHR